MLVQELFEDIFVRDRMRAFEAIKKYPRAFVHFSKGIKSSEKQRSPMSSKLGINPKPNHHDTPGIYFYYNSWLLHSDDMSDSQYATHYEHYWICDIEKTSNCIDFGNFNAPKAAGIARRNGWYEEMEKTLANPELKTWVKQKNILKSAAGKFWAAMDYIANESKTFTWLQMLKGVDAIFDPGKGIINADEPAQVVVLNKSLIKVIDHGENRNDEDKTVAGAMKKVAEEIGGKLSFENRNIIIRVERNGIPLTLRYDRSGNIHIGSFQNGVWVETLRERSYQSEDLDWFAKGLKQSIDNFYQYKKPEATGRISVWTEDKINAISKLITNNSMRIRHKLSRPDGSLYFTTGHNGWGAMHFDARYTAAPDDTLNVEISFYSNHRYDDKEQFEIKATGSYPSNTSLHIIADGLLSQLHKEAEQAVQKGTITSIEALKKVSGLRI